MQLLRLVIGIVSLAIAAAAQAGGVVIVGSSGASGLWLALAVWAAAPPAAKDSCTFVAGVRHCPREPR